MHVALVEHLEPRPGERWLDLGTGAGDVAFHAARAGCGRDRLRSLAGARRDGAAACGRARPRPDARGRRLPEPPLRRRVVRRRLLVGGRDLRARPRTCCPRAGPRLPARWPRRPDRLAKGERRRRRCSTQCCRTCRPPPPGVGSPFQWGDEAYVEAMLGDAFDLSFDELDTRLRRETTPARCGRSSAITTARRSRSGRRSTTSSAQPSIRDMTAYFESEPHRRRHQRRAALHRRHGRAQGLISGRTHSSSR